MKYFYKILCLFILLIPNMVSEVNAQGKWWEKATSIFKKQDIISTSTKPNLGEIGDAFKEALRIGSETVVNKLGANDGFNADPAIHIPLPKKLNTVKSMLSKVGMSGVVEDLEIKLNRAAEVATPKAKQLFIKSISNMTFSDVMNIYEGPDDSATQYFKENMTQSLRNEMRPIVESSLSEVGAVKSYDNVMS
ncbi:MAG: hypothetical protein ACI9XC_001024 [Gammaproteobacteria bacterium]|jgi:hypothetical protein